MKPMRGGDMKHIVSCILCGLLLASSPCFAGGKGSPQSSGRSGYLKKDPISENRVNIYDKRGRQDDYLKQDPVLENRTNIFRNPK
jgi:hypothetical protein